MMDELDKLLAEYKGAYMKYPEERRAIEAKFMALVVEEIKALKLGAYAPEYFAPPEAPRIRPIGVEGKFQLPETAVTFEMAGTAYDSGAAGHELVGRKKPGRPPKDKEAA